MTRKAEAAIGETVVYPGHPVTLALCITHVFESFEAATAPGKEYWAVMESNDVPGAGGNVHDALDLLDALRGGLSDDLAVQDADRMWEHYGALKARDPACWREGQEQADRMKPLLLARREWWAKG